MSVKSKDIFIIGAKRTPFCKYGGPLRELPACHVFAATAKDAIHSAKVDPSLIDNTIIGNVNFISQCDGGKTGRYCGIYSGVSLDKPALTVNKNCGSGIQSIISSAIEILIGTPNITLTGGTELMSSLPQIVRNIRFGATLGSNLLLEDYIKKEYLDTYTGLSLQRMAEDLALKKGISRKDADEFAWNSRLKWQTAQKTNHFAEEITKMTVTIKKKEVVLEEDDIQNVTKEDIEQYPALIDNSKEALLTVGNTTSPADGASALVIAHEEAIKANNLEPLARIAGWACVGVDPVESGLGAAEAIRKLVKDRDVKIGDVDLFEINETFASEVLLTAQELSLDLGKVNVNGGALAVGHPLAASGARLVTHLVYEMRRRQSRRAVAAASCGGGQGVAIMLERY